MKNLKPSLVLTSAVAVTLLTGCASMDRSSYSGRHEPVNTLAYTTVTDPSELVKWTGSKFTSLSMRGMDLYYFQVPDTGYNPGGVFSDVAPSDNVYVRSGDMDTMDADSGVGGPGSYESGTGSYKVIRHQPGNAR